MKRVLIVYDGESWFVRRVASTMHDGIRNEKVYTCDKHLGGPYPTLGCVPMVLDEILSTEMGRNKQDHKNHHNPEPFMRPMPKARRHAKGAR